MVEYVSESGNYAIYDDYQITMNYKTKGQVEWVNAVSPNLVFYICRQVLISLSLIQFRKRLVYILFDSNFAGSGRERSDESFPEAALHKCQITIIITLTRNFDDLIRVFSVRSGKTPLGFGRLVLWLL